MELTIKIKDKDFDKVTAFLKTLDVEIIESNTPASIMSEPMAKYGQKKRPSADEIEQMIIKKAMLDAKAIERGELETYPLDNLLYEMDNKTPTETKADAWKRVGQDEEMTVLANAGLDDFKNIIKDYETT